VALADGPHAQENLADAAVTHGGLLPVYSLIQLTLGDYPALDQALAKKAIRCLHCHASPDSLD
jgi:hypothetical protein